MGFRMSRAYVDDQALQDLLRIYAPLLRNYDFNQTGEDDECCLFK